MSTAAAAAARCLSQQKTGAADCRCWTGCCLNATQHPPHQDSPQPPPPLLLFMCCCCCCCQVPKSAKDGSSGLQVLDQVLGKRNNKITKPPLLLLMCAAAAAASRCLSQQRTAQAGCKCWTRCWAWRGAPHTCSTCRSNAWSTGESNIVT
jgi:hypothetical protein